MPQCTRSNEVPTPSSLPAPANPIIGRDIERVAVAEQLTHGRLSTLTGPGGVGKTRLALQVGTDLQDLFPAGVTWVPLAHVGDPQAVMPALAQALGLHEQDDQTALEALIEHLRTDDRLLVLDNFEQVLAASVDLPASRSTRWPRSRCRLKKSLLFRVMPPSNCSCSGRGQSGPTSH
jgi:ATP/maltotriose-dependent transcriptional regulator MalT